MHTQGRRGSCSCRGEAYEGLAAGGGATGLPGNTKGKPAPPAPALARVPAARACALLLSESSLHVKSVCCWHLTPLFSAWSVARHAGQPCCMCVHANAHCMWALASAPAHLRACTCMQCARRRGFAACMTACSAGRRRAPCATPALSTAPAAAPVPLRNCAVSVGDRHRRWPDDKRRRCVVLWQW